MRTPLRFWSILIECLFIFSTPAIAAINYCSSKFCNNTRQHTLCRFGSSEPSLQCMSYEATIKVEEHKQVLLDKINSRRNKIASGDVRSFPAAGNMLKLAWNKNLEQSAQRWADQCIGNNAPDRVDACRDLQGNIPVGQIIASVYGEAPGLSPMSLVDVWYMELLHINSSYLPRYRPSFEIGFSHYDYFTQLVWARSSEVGCGGVKFKEQSSSAVWNRTIHRLVCNFAPSGNIFDEAVYEQGPPCSRCPDGGSCDAIYSSLCSTLMRTTSQEPETNTTKPLIITKPVLSNESFAKEDKLKNLINTEDENSTIFDYFSEVYDFKREPETTVSVESLNPCKDALAVDDFVELLKKKLATDPMFKEILSTEAPTQNGNIDSSFTDPSVAAFVSRIYSKKETSTTTKMPEPEYVNSTLLADLVEAVIFRSGSKIHTGTEEPRETLQPLSSSEIKPIKVQAELAEVKLNHDFTGHYFFPEDTTEESDQETTDSYYDASSPSVSDVILELENLKKDRVTHDFLEDIIDSDTDESTIVNTLVIDAQVKKI